MTYNEFIQNIINIRGQWNIPEGEYFERHHIIPKCKDGSNSKENIIYLYAREHFIAHKLLAEENPKDYQLVNAYMRMTTSTNGDYNITPEEYEEAKKLFSKLQSENLKALWANLSSEEKFLRQHKGHLTRKSNIEKYNATIEKTRQSLLNKTPYEKALIKEKRKNSLINKSEAEKQLEHIHRSEAAKKRMANLSKEKLEAIIKKSKQTKANWSEEKRREIIAKTTPQGVKVVCIETGVIYNSIKEANEWCGGNVCNVCKGRSKTAGGYHWKYL